MKILIIYDSVFGNTERLALAISDSLNGSSRVSVVKIKDERLENLFDTNLFPSRTKGHCTLIMIAVPPAFPVPL